RLMWGSLACFSAFLTLCFYDLWIGGFLVFTAIWFLSGQDASDAEVSAWWRRTAIYVGAMALAFIVWCGWIAIVGARAGHLGSRLALTFDHIPVLLLSMHLRVANWFISAAGGRGPDWLGLWKMGIDAFSAPLGALLFAAGFALLIMTFARFAASVGGTGEKDDPALGSAWRPFQRAVPDSPDGGGPPSSLALEIFPWRILFFAWMMFLASRLAIILQGGVAISSRLNYGAGMAVALLAAALARWAWHRWCSRALVLRWVATIGVVG